MNNRFGKVCSRFCGAVCAILVAGNVAAGVMLESVRVDYDNGWFIELLFDDTIYEAPPFPVQPFDPKSTIVSVNSNSPIGNSLPTGGYMGVAIEGPTPLEVLVTSFFLEWCEGLCDGTSTVGSYFLATSDGSLYYEECLAVELEGDIPNCTEYDVNNNIVEISRSGVAVLADASVPSPATLALFGIGLVGLGWSRRKRA